jgi:hypothetical protein
VRGERRGRWEEMKEKNREKTREKEGRESFSSSSLFPFKFIILIFK